MQRISLLVVLILSSAVGAAAQAPNTISTVAGGGTNPASATSAYLPGAFGIVRDAVTGNTYVSLEYLSVVYKVDPSGNITLYAGNAVEGFSGDGGAATSAQLDFPSGIAVDASGNLFIADAQNNRIRRVDVNSHIITTVAGSGNQYNGLGFFGGFSGDGGPATGALLNFPLAVAVDQNGNLFIADTNNNRIRMVDNSPEHIITTYAGNGGGCAGQTDAIGDGCPAVEGSIAGPQGVAVHSSGDLYIADSNERLIRKVDNSSSHIITTYAGNGGGCAGQTDTVGDGCSASLATLDFPTGVAVDSSENVFISDTQHSRVRKVDTTTNHIITTVAGNGSLCTSLTATPVNCGDGGAATSALLNSPVGVFVDGLGNILYADLGANRFRIVTAGSTPTISNYAGGGAGGDTGVATAAVIGIPFFVDADSAGDLFLVDNGGYRIRRVDATTQDITNFAGNGVRGVPGAANGDGGPATQANISSEAVNGMSLDSAGNLYFADTNNFVVRRVDAKTGLITLVAGTYGVQCQTGNCGDGGPATSATFIFPVGVAIDSSGNVYISDAGNNRIRVVSMVGSVPGNISNFAGTGPAGPPSNGPALSATLNGPNGMAFDANGNLYFADSGNNVIRKIDTSGNISTVAFNGVPTFGGDGGSVLSASMNSPGVVALDSAGNLFVGGGFDNVVRRIDAQAQTVITVAGDITNLDGGFNGDGELAPQALLSNFGLAIVKNTTTNVNILYIADAGNNRIRKVVLAPTAAVDSSLLTPFGPVLAGASSSSGDVTITNNGLDDLIVSNVSVPAGFTLSNDCQIPGTAPTPVAPGGGECLLLVEFTPPAGTAGGTPFSGNLTFNTNDPANPSFSFPLSGSVPSQPAVPLTVTFAGSGSGTVTGSVPGLGVASGSPTPLSCPTTCTLDYALGQQVTLIAIGNAGSALAGWTVNGSTTTCPGTTPECTVTMSAAQNVTANFGPSSITVSAMGNGSGTIAITPGGPTCTVTNGAVTSGPCTADFGANSQLTITATATGSSTFSGWLGFCGLIGINTSGTGPCTVQSSISGVTALNGAIATAVFSGPAQTFGQGDVFVGTVDGMIFEYKPTGTLVQVLNSGNFGGIIAGMDFDASGNLYAANPDTTAVTGAGGTVEFFGNNGTGPTTFGTTPYNSGPLGVVVAPTGNVFVGQSSGQNSLLEITSAGVVTSTFFPAFDNGGVGYIELLDDGGRVLYTSDIAGSSQPGSVKNFDIANNAQNPDFATNLPGGPAFAIRELSDKSVLVANATQIVHLDPTGKILTTPSLTPPAGGLFFALNLNPDGLSFWTGDALSGKVYQIQISSGTVLATINTGLGFNSSALSFSTIFGIAVFGQPQSGGADVAVTMTAAPNPVAQNSNITYTTTVTNNGPLNATNVTATDVFPAGVTFVSAATSQGSCSGTTTVTCNLGTMQNGSSATITTVVTATQTGTLTNTVNVTSTVPDPDTANNTATATTAVTGGGGGGLTITPSTLPNGAVGASYGQELFASGGTPPFNFTISAGTLPAGLTLGATIGTIAGVPTGPAGASTFTVNVTDSSATPLTGSANFTITIAAADNSNNSELNGSYAFLFQGFNDSDGTMVVVAGSFVADGHGNILSGGFEDADTVGSTGTQPPQELASSSYTIGADNRGSLSLTTLSGTTVLAISVGDIQAGVATKARFIRFDDVSGTNGHTGSGVILKQDPAAVGLQLAAIKGSYAFGESGSNLTNGNPESGVGFLNSDGNGNFTPAGLVNLNGGGGTGPSQALSGTYAVTSETVSSGRLSASVTVASVTGTVSDVVYIVSQSQFIFISINTSQNTVYSGIAQLQVPPAGGFGLSSLNGNSVVAVQGKQSGGASNVLIGNAAFDGKGNFTLAFDQNKAGTLLTSTATGTYTVASNGQTVVTVTTGGLSNAVLYLDAANQGFLGASDTLASEGFIEPGGSGFSNASLSGNYFIGTFDPTTLQSSDLSGVASFDGIGTLQTTTDETNPGNLEGGKQVSTPYNIASNGRLTFTATQPVVGYVASGCEAEVITTNGAHPGLASFECQVLQSTLIVGEAGTGTGTVSSNPTGIACPATTCSASFASGSQVVLTATPTGNSTFTSFSTNCTPANPQTNPPTCTVTMTGSPTVTVTFTAGSATTPSLEITKSHTGSFTQGQQGATYTVTVLNGAGAGPTTGTVTVTDTIPSGLTLVSMAGTGWTCVAASCTRSDALAGGTNYPVITVTVNVAANAASPQVNMASVSGGGSAAPPPATDSTVIMGSNNLILTVTEGGSGTGTVSSVPAGINCPVTTCSASFASGTVVALTAMPSDGSTFAGWSGGGCTGTGGCSVTMTAAQTVTATFNSGNSPVTIGLAPGSPSTVNTTPGSSAVFGLTLTSLPGTTGTVTLGCTSISPNITCNIVPSSITLTGKAINVAIVVNTFCQAAVPAFGPSIPAGLPGGLALLASMWLCGALWTFKRRPRLALSFAVLVLIAVGMSACSNLPKSPGGQATKPGLYPLVVTATAPNGAVSSVNLTLNVLP